MELSLSIGAFIKTGQDVIKTFLKNEQLTFGWIDCESIKKDLIWTSNLIIFNLVDKNFTLLIIYCYQVFCHDMKKKLNIFRGIRERKPLFLQFLWKKAQKDTNVV